jgi:hypothetical protein
LDESHRQRVVELEAQVAALNAEVGENARDITSAEEYNVVLSATCKTLETENENADLELLEWNRKVQEVEARIALKAANLKLLTQRVAEKDRSLEDLNKGKGELVRKKELELAKILERQEAAGRDLENAKKEMDAELKKKTNLQSELMELQVMERDYSVSARRTWSS